MIETDVTLGWMEMDIRKWKWIKGLILLKVFQWNFKSIWMFWKLGMGLGCG